MGKTLQPVATGCNKSLRVESRAERLNEGRGGKTVAPRWGRVSLPKGAVVLYKIMERSDNVAWMIPQMTDPKRQEDVVHDLVVPHGMV